MIRIDSNQGIALMREYGIPDWPDVDSTYYSWEDCGVFSIYPFDDGVQLDMAMRKGFRHYARDMVSDIIAKVPGVIYAPILDGRISVMNLALKMGFEYYADGISTTGDSLKIYRRG